MINYTPIYDELSDNFLDRRVHVRIKYTISPRGVWSIFQKIY
nr:MAG TPA: hypothetical protein [Caudoviricetes sp.]